ncbi:MAG: Zn-dependent oligopeptidase [Verrucomicrobia bacterium]|nr:Zn-dependent oligopeptidase [Verrucomicrobiota bacterium]
MKQLEEFQTRAASFGSALNLPDFETTPDQVRETVRETIARANAALDAIGNLHPGQVTFQNTVQALDDLVYTAGLTANRVYLAKETSENEGIRDAATEMVKAFDEWAVGLEYREDVYAAVQAFADSKPELTGEDQKVFEETLRDYRRAGLHLPKTERAEVERMRKRMATVSTDFNTNINKAELALEFSRDELEGVPEDFLSQQGIRQESGRFRIMVTVTHHFVTVMENARRESIRKQLKEARYSLVRENLPLMREILELRRDIAGRLGYASWADYKIEPRMARTAETASAFLNDLNEGLQSKFDQELECLRALKVSETGNPDDKIHLWDWRYYGNQLKKSRYTIDTEALRSFFPYDRVLTGMFTLYGNLFGLKIEAIAPPQKWTASLELYVVSDAESGEPLGTFYLDMYPRTGKFNHFAQFGIIEGKQLPSGQYQRPCVALICNFPEPEAGKPSLLNHREVETLFHEFGHGLHSILTRARFARFSGTNVPRDFVEVPSQILENWAWDKTALDSFAADYRDPTVKIPAELIAKLKEAKLATVGMFYRRQLAMGLLDLKLHTDPPGATDEALVSVSNKVLSEVFLSVPDTTCFISYFGHLTGYDAGYYGYAWADAIAADMATVFEESPEGFLDTKAGRRLRDEVYAPGGSREVDVSIQRFLQRPRSIEPFLKSLGIGAGSKSATVQS